jgi:hypothetical protein
MNPIMPAGIINISVENNQTLVIKYRTAMAILSSLSGWLFLLLLISGA